MQRVDSLEKTLMLGGIGGRRKKGRQRMRWLDGITDSMDVSLGWTLGVGDGQGGLACCDSWGGKESDTTEWLNWTVCQELAKCGKYNMNEAGFWFHELIFFWGDPSICIPAQTKPWHLSAKQKLCALDKGGCQEGVWFWQTASWARYEVGLFGRAGKEGRIPDREFQTTRK